MLSYTPINLGPEAKRQMIEQGATKEGLKAVIESKLQRLKEKQRVLDEAWKRTGNRDLTHFFIDIIPRLLSTERCSVFILDPKTSRIWLHCGTDLEEREVSVPRSNSMVGNVIATGKHLIQYDVDARAGIHERVDQQTGFTTKSALCVPIFNMAGDQVVGVLQALNKLGNREFSNDDIKLLKRVAFHIQMNIENVYLRQEISHLSETMGQKIKKLEGILIRHGIESALEKKEVHSLPSET
jgi:transcriptional regulator with GAF, ATPase, and Fis domain